MTWNELVEIVKLWTPAISTSALLIFAGKLLSPIYKSQIEKSIQSKFDKKLEALRSQLRLEEEEVKAGFKSRDEQIAALRNGALSGLVARQSLADKRRLQSVEAIWNSVVSARFLKTLAIFTGVLKMEEVMKMASSNGVEATKMKIFLDQIWDSHKLDKVESIDWADRERPFVSTQAWIKFTVYKQVLLYPYALLALARVGAGPEAINGPEKILETVSNVLPHQKSYLDKFGAGALCHLLEELEQSLLSELITDIHGEEADAKAVQQAAAIISSASTLNRLYEAVDKNVDVPEALRRLSA